jgi:ABC-type transporter Mla MlaB component
MTRKRAMGSAGALLVLGGPITCEGLEPLCERARAMLEGSDVDPVVCDIGALADPDAVTIDAMARLQLTARRLGRRIRFRDACGEVQRLVGFMGLEDILPLGSASGPEHGREPEEREQALGVEEEADP